jgi:hypothetical protein
METLRLRRINEPSRLERLLEAFISSVGALPDGAYQIRNPRELPQSLQTLLARALEDGQVWSCWARSSQLWLFTGHMPLAQARERGVPVMLVHLYDEDAQLKESGTWRFDSRANWTRLP